MSYSESDLYRLPKDILIKIICQISTELKEKHDKIQKKNETMIRLMASWQNSYSSYVELFECDFCDMWSFIHDENISSANLDKFEEKYDFDKHKNFHVNKCNICHIKGCYEHVNFIRKNTCCPILCEKCYLKSPSCYYCSEEN